MQEIWRKHLLGTVLLLAFGLRAGYSLVGLPIRMAIDPRPIGDDGYQDIARSWLETGVYTNQIRAPLYPAFLATIFFFGGNAVAVRLIHAALDTGTCLMIYLLARRVLSTDRAALVAALIYALYYPMINLTSKYATETLHVFLAVVFLWTYWNLYRDPTV